MADRGAIALAALAELGASLNDIAPHNLAAALLARAAETDPAALFTRFEAERARIPLKTATVSSESPELAGLMGLPKYAVTLQYGGALAPLEALRAALAGGARPTVIESLAERGPGPRVPTF